MLQPLPTLMTLDGAIRQSNLYYSGHTLSHYVEWCQAHGTASFGGVWVGIATTLVSFLVLAPVPATRNFDVLPVFIGATVAVGYVVVTATTDT
jgi:hypothetical protein